MPKTIIGLFAKPSEASEAVRELVAMGFARDDIGLIAKAAEGELAQDPDSTRATVATGKDTDVDSRPGTADKAPNLRAALTKLGVAEREAEHLTGALRRGGTLVSAAGDDAMVDHALALLKRHHAYTGVIGTPGETLAPPPEGPISTKHHPAAEPNGESVRQDKLIEPPTTEQAAGPDARVVVEVVLRQEAGERARTDVYQVPPAGASGVEAFDTDFRKNFDATFAIRGYTYEQVMSAYHYGYMLAIDPRNRGKDWMAITIEAKQEWESFGKGLWEEFEGAVRYGWDRAYGREQKAQVTL
ncbi:MAG: hypothetical protein ACREVH_03250 [Gammaproteobacteria bacterium]